MNKILIEVIADSLDDAIKIEQAGANRIELLIDLDHGGLTPPFELVKSVCEKVKIPVRVMIRDVFNNFVYSDQIMKSHINFIKKIANDTNAEGIVFGSLNLDNSINFTQLQDVINAKKNLKLTFHRAFDETNSKNIIENLNLLKKYKVDTLLTSGTKETALLGKDIIKELILNADNLEILPGKSITIDNAKELLNYTNAKSIHIGSAVKENGQISIKKIQDLISVINK